MIRHTAFRLVVFLCVLCLCMSVSVCNASAQTLEESVPITLASPSVMLLEADSGAVIFEKNADEKRPVASVTKLMTALIVLEKLENGELALDNMVTVSPNAASATGSQALLDAHAQYSIETLLKATVMASGNDSAVALAEHVAGTEEAFAQMMNERALQLGMCNTHYVNCTGLPAEGQYTTARDVAAVSLAVARHPLYFEYASVWMDELKHPSGRVTDLTNTNRLVRFYSDCDGLKTGSTNEAKYCVSATAKRNGMRLIAVVLGSSASQTRFDEARAMLDYGFATYKRVQVVNEGDRLGQYSHVQLGAVDEVEAAMGSDLILLLKSGQEKALKFETELYDTVQAPIDKGNRLGTVRILLNGEIITEIPAVAADSVRLPGFLEGFKRIFDCWK